MRLRFRISGLVQGVGYRASALRAAAGLSGWVANRSDGDVEGVVEGAEVDVEAFLAWCARGPSGARVSGVHRAVDTEDEPFGTFVIRR